MEYLDVILEMILIGMEGQGIFDSYLKVYVAGLVSFEYRRYWD